MFANCIDYIIFSKKYDYEAYQKKSLYILTKSLIPT